MNTDTNPPPGDGRQHRSESSGAGDRSSALDVLAAWLGADTRRRVWSEGGALHVLDENSRGDKLAFRGLRGSWTP